MSSKPAIIVGTDGSPEHDRNVRHAAHAARSLGVPLHVVCCVPTLTAVKQREIDRSLPGDLAHLAGPHGQRAAALDEARALVGDGCELFLTASEQRLERALRQVARAVNGELYGAGRRRLKLRLPALGLRARATA